jgi:hypothetical protein
MAHGIGIASHACPPTGTTMLRSTPTLYRASCLALVGILALAVRGLAPPVAAGHLDAVIVTVLSLGDGASVSVFEVNNLNDRVSIDSATQSLSDSTGSGPPALGLLGYDLFNGDFGDGVINAVDSGPEALGEELADARGNPVIIDGLWALRLDSRDVLDKAQLAAATVGPGLYDDPDWFDSATLVLLGGGAGVALVSLGLSRIRIHRRHRARSPSHRRSHRRPHRAR